MRVVFDATALYVAVETPSTLENIVGQVVGFRHLSGAKRLFHPNPCPPRAGKHSFKLFGLPAHHNDPFDRMLIATALAEDISIAARDREFRKYKGLRAIW